MCTIVGGKVLSRLNVSDWYLFFSRMCSNCGKCVENKTGRGLGPHCCWRVSIFPLISVGFCEYSMIIIMSAKVANKSVKASSG